MSTDISAVPVKYEQVVFCGLSDFQLSLYNLFLTAPEIKALLRGQDSQPLKAINILKKLCNHPELLNLPDDLKGSEHLIPDGFCGAGSTSKGRNQGVRCDWSGKFVVLERFVSTLLPDRLFLTGAFTGFCTKSKRRLTTRSSWLVTILKR